jgi:phosphatidylserine/phosphatidylglycerophosphate/cardiolipin synthase-like enzyme
MKWILRLIATFFFISLIGVSVIWVVSKSLVSPEQEVKGSEVLRLVEKFSWVQPSESFTKEQNFSLHGRPPFQTITPSENQLFDFDPGVFVTAQKGASFREAQLNYFNRMQLDVWLNHYAFDSPHMQSWGALPYPPIREISQLNVDRALSQSKWARDSEYQHELDRITGHELTKNDSIEVFQNGDVITPILKLIGDSKRFVFVNVLSLVCDPSTEPIIHGLEDRAQAGVDVRVILNKGYSLLDPACLQRLTDHQIQIVKAPTHSSYYVNDDDDIVLGAESMARMFLKSDGYNFLDRDLMISVKGPVATDAVKNFVSVWDKYRAPEQRDVKLPVTIYVSKRASELKGNLCRFAEQMPGGEERSMEKLLVSLAEHSKEKIFLSGVKFDPDSPLFKTALTRAREGVDFNYLGNGWEGGDGELTLYLDELIRDHSTLAPVLSLLRNWDVNRVARKRALASTSFVGGAHIELWSFYSFLHYKLALFDQEGSWVGSANPDWDSVTGYDESGIFCMDKTLMEKLSDTTDVDLANSIPVSTLRH